MSYIASAISRTNLRELADWIRKATGYENKPYFPIIEFMENVMPGALTVCLANQPLRLVRSVAQKISETSNYSRTVFLKC